MGAIQKGKKQKKVKMRLTSRNNRIDWDKDESLKDLRVETIETINFHFNELNSEHGVLL